jgi:hypothetical protein
MASKMAKPRPVRRTCVVAVCPSPKDASYHRFPANDTVQKLWLKACKRKDFVNTKNGFVCSYHFAPEDFERDLQNELLNRPLRSILKKGIISSIKMTKMTIVDQSVILKKSVEVFFAEKAYHSTSQ